MWQTIIPAALDFAGGLLGNKSSGAAKEARHIQWHSWLTQQDMAYNGVQRRVEDAKKAGVHPLAALGMNPYQGSVASVVGDVGGGKSALGHLARAGADISRGIAAGQSQEERTFTKQMADLQLERGSLENELLRSQIAGQRAQLAPAMPTNPTAIKAALADMPTPLGSEDGLIPLHQTTYDEKGNPIRVFNSNGLGDSEVLTALHAIGYSIPDLIHGHIGRPAGQWLGRNVRRMRRLGREYNKFQK